jgi:hypothetical protein
MTILFYHQDDPYGCFSNFSRHPVNIYDRVWMTSEHAFQAMKFHTSPVHMDLVFNAPTPGQAANKHGRNRSYPLRPDWDQAPSIQQLSLIQNIRVFEDGIDRKGVVAEHPLARVKDVIMYEVCLAKFQQHEACRKELLSTGDEILIEDTRSSGDAYWGWGTSMVGENKLGRLLMTIRQQLR